MFCIINGEQMHVSFLLVKSSVCPKKKVSVLWFELMAAEMFVLMVVLISTELDISVDRIMYWTGTTCILHSIKNSDLKPVLFVAN